MTIRMHIFSTIEATCGDTRTSIVFTYALKASTKEELPESCVTRKCFMQDFNTFVLSSYKYSEEAPNIPATVKHNEVTLTL